MLQCPCPLWDGTLGTVSSAEGSRTAWPVVFWPCLTRQTPDGKLGQREKARRGQGEGRGLIGTDTIGQLHFLLPSPGPFRASVALRPGGSSSY